MSDCVFCEIVAGTSPAKVAFQTDDVIVFHPLGPQVPGHLLFVPKDHVADATTSPDVTARVMREASAYAKRLNRPVNIITSAGAEATQTVFHLHIHVLPRGKDDGVRASWPWTRAAH